MNHHLRCTTCGHTGPLPKTMHVGGGASVGKRIPGHCSVCNAIRTLAVVPMPDGLEHDQVWRELLAYVAEGGLSTDLALEILQSKAADARKREVAALVAEGSLPGAEGLKLLRAV